MMRQHNYYVYMLASRIGGTLYVGVTNDLERRVSEHRLGEASKFTRKYAVLRLVWYEAHPDVTEAIRREKRLKKWDRSWKVALIEEQNPHWSDLLPHITTAGACTGSPGQAGG
jgi:putative endonuclease